MAVVGCHMTGTSKNALPGKGSAGGGSAASAESQNQSRDAERLKLCQEQLQVLRSINEKQYLENKRAFDTLMNGASQYAGLRPSVNNVTQDTVDALYRYKVNYLCAEVDQMVLTGLSHRVEPGK
ncbi:hypothetical protein ACOA8Y_003759 [Serratia marcescens]|uniref:Uncharacterized protein n=1 Tax=Serratia marcescens TaxID=615 RepID=A0AAP8PW89_SERMA|nr:hypothetical protein [Serratia marcescens]MBH3233359.1 hypothetical protein [Serratia marcescens]POP17317.1 hypothetical protein C3R40_07545 [Serratia marcescens]